ncbi:MAG TPA: hypothetical protein VFD70_11955 [Anaerolineae bacterium]|nr:hypothetical protein [Anaerolineae bacterium]
MPNSVSVRLKLLWLFLFTMVSMGCSSLETRELKPVAVAQDCTSKNSNWPPESWCNSTQPFGQACSGSQGPIKANTLQAFTDPTIPPASGWGDNYDKGTQPLACPWWVSTFSRAYVKFDVVSVVLPGPAQSIEGASLVWKTKRLAGNSAKACLKFLYEATGIWQRGNTPANLLFDNLDATAVNAGFYGVAAQAQKWFAHPEQNFGLMIEPSRASTQQYSDSECIDSLQDLRLTVKYRVNAIQWPQ